MLDATTLILLVSVAPPLFYALLLGSLHRGPWGPAAVALSWGIAVAALVAAPLNDRLLALLVAGAGEAWGQATATGASAPLVEELLKGLGVLLLLVLRPDAVRGARDGAFLGAMVGLGFEMVENRHYLTVAAVQAGMAGLWRGLWVRGVLGGLKHALFAGITGAGLGWARLAPRGRRRLVVPLGALGAAVVQHGVWNVVASQAITDALCSAPGPGAACQPTPPASALFLTVPLIVAFCMAPGTIGLWTGLRRSGARAANLPPATGETDRRLHGAPHAQG